MIHLKNPGLHWRYSASANAREYSPLGSKTMKRAFGLHFPLSTCACSSDQRISPATEHDLPLPVFPNMARCRPNRRSGSMQTSAFPARGLVPILTRRRSPDSTIERSCFSVGRSTLAPIDGRASAPRRNEYFSSSSDFVVSFRRVPSGLRLNLRRGYGKSISPKSCIPRRFGNADRSTVSHSICPTR